MSADELKGLGNAAFQAGKFEEAIEHFTAAIEVAPQNHVLYSNRSACRSSLQQYNQALEDANKVIELKPDWFKGYSRKGAALQGLGNLEEAFECYEEGLKQSPGNETLTTALQELQREGQARANAGMAPLVQGLNDPNLPAKLLANPATASFATDPDFLAKLKEVQTNPQSIGKYIQDPRMMAVLETVMGIKVVSSPDEVSQEPEPAPTPQPKKAPPPKKEEPKKELTEDEKTAKQAEEIKQEGNKLYKARQFDEAIEKYDEAIKLNPKEMTFHLNKAAVFLEKGDFTESIEAANTAIDVGRSARTAYKNIAKAYCRIGNVHLRQDKFDEAIKAYESSLTEAYTDEANRKLKECKKKKKEQEELAYLDDAKAVESKEKGNEFFRQGQYREALREYEESLRRNPKAAPVFSNLSACYGKLGDFPRGIEFADKCLALDPTFHKAHLRKAGFQFYLKEYHKAIDSYQEALKLDPENAEAKDGIMRTRIAIQTTMGDEERAQHAMADPEIQAIMSDPVIQQVLRDFSTSPAEAQKHLRDPGVAQKIQKLIDAGVLRTK